MASKKPPVPEGISLTKQRAYIADVLVSYEYFSVPCDFVAAKATDNSVKFKVICAHPEHGKEAVAPAQRYLCEGNTVEDKVRAIVSDASLTKATDIRAAIEAALTTAHPAFTANEGGRAREVDKALHPVTPEEIAEIKSADTSDITEGQMALLSSPKEQVQAQVIPSGTVYRLRPRNGAFQAYSILMDAIERTYAEYQVYGEIIARDTQKMFLVSVFTDPDGTRQLIAQESLRPGDMAELDKCYVDVSERHAEKAAELIAEGAVDFEADSYVNQRKVKAAEMDDRLRNVGGGTATGHAAQAARAANPANGSDNIMAALEASAVAAREKKARKAS